jgi:predicted deacetylase
MNARYLIRFDDICPTMNWIIWNQIEAILIEADIKPILAVVPDNQDSKLMLEQPNPFFWEKVRYWQSLGWTIGLHGYQHSYVTTDSGIIGINNRSEFAGLPLAEQERKLVKALQIFKRENVTPNLWIAPAHSFDKATVKILHKYGIRCISDGYFLLPHVDTQGVMWLPQQLWRFKGRPCGLWTVCFHHNGWNTSEIERLKQDITRYKNSITTVTSVCSHFSSRRLHFFETFMPKAYLGLMNLKQLVWDIWTRLR